AHTAPAGPGGAPPRRCPCQTLPRAGRPLRRALRLRPAPRAAAAAPAHAALVAGADLTPGRAAQAAQRPPPPSRQSLGLTARSGTRGPDRRGTAPAPHGRASSGTGRLPRADRLRD